MLARPSLNLASLLALLLLTTGCGRPLTIATWLEIEPGSTIATDVFGNQFVSPIEGGVFAVIDLDLTNPLHINGTIRAEQVRIAGQGPPFGELCIRRDTDLDIEGTISIEVLSNQQDVDFPLAVVATSTFLNGQEIRAVGSPAPGSIQFPIDAALIEPIIEMGSLEGELSLPVAIQQDFVLAPGFSIPALIDLVLTSRNQPPGVSQASMDSCGAFWDQQGRELDYAMNSRGTYLRTVWDGGRRDPQKINLAEIGAMPGDVLRLTRKGSFSDQVLQFRNRIVGVFSDSSEVRSSPIGWTGPWWRRRFNPSRVPGAIDAGSNVTTPRTFWLWRNTDIPEDFEITNQVDVVVPGGANFLLLSPVDDLFSENASFDLRVGIEVNP